ncbi:MAG: hypothetical protein D6705_02250 [Deltaproteobacteria bacterium]|nr:MAG: hypothetical protein D6705_02250 [Deltaproteobacteria bacterium]
MVTVVAGLLLACNKGDVGAPCNHGQVDPPESKVVTFPALACNELVCVYADEAEPPPDPCATDEDCNAGGVNQVKKFQCVKDEGENQGECQLAIDYVLERSMCSKKCSSDDDCKNQGIKKVTFEGTECREGFACARIQSLGEFCCEKLCVCRDDLTVDTDLDSNCAAGTQEGCCVKNGQPVSPLPEACGVQ